MRKKSRSRATSLARSTRSSNCLFVISSPDGFDLLLRQHVTERRSRTQARWFISIQDQDSKHSVHILFSKKRFPFPMPKYCGRGVFPTEPGFALLACTELAGAAVYARWPCAWPNPPSLSIGGCTQAAFFFDRHSRHHCMGKAAESSRVRYQDAMSDTRFTISAIILLTRAATGYIILS